MADIYFVRSVGGYLYCSFRPFLLRDDSYWTNLMDEIVAMSAADIRVLVLDLY